MTRDEKICFEWSDRSDWRKIPNNTQVYLVKSSDSADMVFSAEKTALIYAWNKCRYIGQNANVFYSTGESPNRKWVKFRFFFGGTYNNDNPCPKRGIEL